MKEFDADILPVDFDGKAAISDCRAIATKVFGSEDTALWENCSANLILHLQLFHRWPIQMRDLTLKLGFIFLLPRHEK